MSVPLTKALSPLPRRITTRTAVSASSRSQRSCSPSYIGNVMALRASGRLTVTTATRSAVSSVRCSAIVSIMAFTIAHLANLWDHGGHVPTLPRARRRGRRAARRGAAGQRRGAPPPGRAHHALRRRGRHAGGARAPLSAPGAHPPARRAGRRGHAPARGERRARVGADVPPLPRRPARRREGGVVTRPVILLTGFEPFGGLTANPSEEVAKALDGRAAGDAVVRSAILPVDHAAAAPHVARLIDELDPRAIIHLGLAAGRARIALERVAVNVMDFDTPDNTGYRACNEVCESAGPAAYLATLPLAPMLDALLGRGIPAYLSNTAGTYLCNRTMYATLHLAATRGLGTRAGFVHLPLLPSMVAATGVDAPSMDFALMLEAAETALTVVAA